MTVDPKVVEFRSLRFNAVADLLAEVDRLIAAERAGTLRHTGNWTLGQALGHIAGWAAFALDGYPPVARPPWLVKVIIRPMKKRFLARGLPRGMRMRNIPGGTMNTDALTTEQGSRNLRDAMSRLEANATTIPNPAFGPLTHAEWIDLNLRHAELHLGYFFPA